MTATAVVAGFAEVHGDGTGQSETVDMHAKALLAALKHAEMEVEDLDGLLTCGSMVDPHPRQHSLLSEQVGLYRKRLCDTVQTGGASGCSAIEIASWAIARGVCDAVAVVGADALLSAMRGRSGAVKRMSSFGGHSLVFEYPFGPTVPSFYAMCATEHMGLYGTTEEDLAHVAVAAREFASMNPVAEKRNLIDIDDVLGSRVISTPLHLLDCSLISDAGSAVILVRDSAYRGSAPAVKVLGTGQGHSYYSFPELESFSTTTAVESGKAAFSQAGLSPADVDVAEIYDSFTITTLINLEDLGFCEKGEGGAFVREVGIGPRGQLPCNTHGGLLSCAHPGVPGGLLHVVEAIRQLRHEAGDRQVEGARVALAHNTSGELSNHSTVILGRD